MTTGTGETVGGPTGTGLRTRRREEDPRRETMSTAGGTEINFRRRHHGGGDRRCRNVANRRRVDEKRC